MVWFGNIKQYQTQSQSEVTMEKYCLLKKVQYLNTESYTKISVATEEIFTRWKRLKKGIVTGDTVLAIC